jgi:hypothetical protein
MKRYFLLFIIALLTGFPAWQSAAAQATVPVEQVVTSHIFGEQVSVRARVRTDQTISQAVAFLRAQGESASISTPVQLGPDGEISFIHQIRNGNLRPFAEVAFWFRFTFADGSTADSAEFAFRYLDNRFPWQVREQDNLRVHWYAGDAAFGQSALDAARSGAERTGQLLSVSLGRPVDIYIYASSEDLRATLQQGGPAWVSGHASPDLYLALVAIAPGLEQAASMERKIPHELAHILTYELAGERYPLLPIWLREGIAAVSETYPSPDYPRSLQVAVENDGLLSFSRLCGDFPVDASSRFLAYAQSESFTRYIVDEYGISGLNRLVLAYADGLGCEQGVQQALGISLSQLEYAWRASSLGENRMAMAFKNLSGYLLVFLMLVFLPIAPALFSSFKPKHG